jgi:hypothetical protein
MDDQREPAGIGEGAIEGVEEPEPVADFSEQEESGIGGEPAPLEIGDDRLGAKAGKLEGVAVTVCHRGGLT